ncbi:MAG: response regulator transcription factor [Clostridia bacterium]|nr:response regulator transcription factor [Clostridia bacterium]
MAQNKTVLVVEDEKNIAEILRFNLEREGYTVLCAYDGADGLEQAQKPGVDLILLDVMLPKMDGFEVCRRLRENSDVPVIMLTAREEENDRIMGLELGADDYVTKPFSPRELMLRVKANIRRAGETPQKAAAPEGRTLRGLTLASDRYCLIRNGKEVELTSKEYELLSFFFDNQGVIFSKEDLMNRVWGYEGFCGDVHAVDVTLSRLRKKVEENPSSPEYIKNRWGVGYYLE